MTSSPLRKSANSAARVSSVPLSLGGAASSTGGGGGPGGGGGAGAPAADDDGQAAGQQDASHTQPYTQRHIKHWWWGRSWQWWGCRGTCC